MLTRKKEAIKKLITKFTEVDNDLFVKVYGNTEVTIEVHRVSNGAIVGWYITKHQIGKYTHYTSAVRLYDYYINIKA